MRKIAIPVASEKLCMHFGHCETFHVFDVSDSGISNEQQLVPPPHKPGAYPEWLTKMGVTDVIAGGMGQKAINLFNQASINVYLGVDSIAPKKVVERFIDGTLESQANLCNH